MKCQIPYGSGALELALSDEMVAEVLESSVAPSQGNEDDLVLAAMASPHGGKTLKDCASAQALMDEILQVPQNETKPDQWEYQIQARILIHHPVIYVSCPEMRQTIEEMKMMYAGSLDEALEMARGIVGEDAKVTVIPNGIAVIVAE